MNEDRHLNNFGIIRDVNTLKWLDVAPIFDNGQSLKIEYYDDEEWERNDDPTFTRDETESNFCTECNYEKKRDINGTAGYDVEFFEYQFLRDLMSYIEVLLDLIYGSIRR